MRKEKIWDEIILTKEAQGEDLATTIGNLILTLLKEEETCKIYNDDGAMEVFVIEHGHDEHISGWGGPILTWVTQEEFDELEQEDDDDDELECVYDDDSDDDWEDYEWKGGEN